MLLELLTPRDRSITFSSQQNCTRAKVPSFNCQPFVAVTKKLLVESLKTSPHSLVHLSFGKVQPLLPVKLYEQVEETGIHCQGQAIKKSGGEGYYVAASVVIESHLGGARQFRGIAGEGTEPSV